MPFDHCASCGRTLWPFMVPLAGKEIICGECYEMLLRAEVRAQYGDDVLVFVRRD